MLDDVQAVTDFYASRRGRLVATLLGRHLRELWPDLSRQRLLGLGHTTPFLPTWRHQALACIDARTRSAGGLMPTGGPTCLVQDDALPFADLSFDRILLAHALEHAPRTGHMLRAVWRVLRDDGRLLMLVPNRTGLWAHSESTPFADGAPYSVGRIQRTLAHGLFRVERVRGALYLPPANLAPVLRFGPTLERAGRRLSPRLSGVLLVEAVKDAYAGQPVAFGRAQARVRRIVAVRAAREGQGAALDPPGPGA